MLTKEQAHLIARYQDRRRFILANNSLLHLPLWGVFIEQALADLDRGYQIASAIATNRF